MIVSSSWRIVLTLLVAAVAGGILLNACGGPACGRLCEGGFWHDEDYVSKNPSVALVQVELDKEVDINAENDDGRTPLRFGLLYGSPEVVELLLDHGAVDKNYPDPLCLASRETQKAELLLDRGANVNAACLLDYSPLMIAVTNGNTSLVQSLILYGADVNAINDHGLTVLVVALRQPVEEVATEEIIQLLLAYGADPNSESQFAGSLSGRPLHWAILEGNVAGVRALLDSGANVEAKNADGETPCDYGKYLAREVFSSSADLEEWEEIEPLVCP